MPAKEIKLEQSTINDKEYYSVKDIKKEYPTLFYGYSKSPRDIIERKNVPVDEYIYATYHEKKEEWTIYDKDQKIPNKVALYISKSWTDDNLLKPKKKVKIEKKQVKNDEIKEEDKEENDKEENDKKEYEEAPNILELDDNEKFKDDEGKTYEIETRGERSHDGIYFLAEDIAKAFDIGNIRMFWYNNESFIYGDHYKSFIVSHIGKKIGIRIYLTLKGVQCVLSAYTPKNGHKNVMLIVNWVKKVLPDYDCNHIVSVKSNESNIGMIYVVTSPYINTVKIGYWSNHPELLRARYTVYYGDDIDLFFGYFENPISIEKEIHNHFKNYNISGELFDKKYIDKYKSFLKNHKENIDIAKANEIIESNNIIRKIDIGRMNNLIGIKNKESNIINIDNNKKLKQVFDDRNESSDKFADWATKTLFTVQMGDEDEKQELASNLIGIPTKSLKQVLSTSITSVPCLYQFSLGKVKSLRKSMNIPKEIPDDHIIIKYGFTEDLARRTKEHEKTYGKIKSVSLELMQHMYIDPKYLAQAETDLKSYFTTNEMKINFDKFKELIAIDPKHKKQITKYFGMVGNKYAGCVRDLMIQIDNLKLKHQSEIEIMNAKTKLIEERYAHLEEKLKYETESLNQKLEIERLNKQILLEKIRK